VLRVDELRFETRDLHDREAIPRLGIALPHRHPRVEVDEVSGLAVNREIRLRVCGQPVVGEVEVVEARRGGRRRALEREPDRRVALRDDPGRQDAGRGQSQHSGDRD